MRALRWVVSLVCVGAVACGSSDDDGSDAGAAGSNGGPSVAGSNGNTGAPGEKVGGFDLQMVAPVPQKGATAATPGLTRIVGRVNSSSVPEATILELASEEGSCRLLTPRVPFCEAGCSGGVCVDDDKCKPNPQARSLGKVTVTGLRSADSAPFTLIDVQNTYQLPGSVKLEYPPFDEGAEVEFSAAGAQFPAFSIKSHGIAPLELPASTQYQLSASTPLALTWTAAGKADVSTIHIKMDISHHGGSKGQIECDVPDNGAYSIPAALVGKLLALGVAGFPTIVLTRTTSATASTAAGDVDLKIYMYQERSVEIPGLVSCTATAECPSGQECKADQTCAAK